MKQILLIVGLFVTSFTWSQSWEQPNPTEVLVGYDENGYAIYKNTRPFYTLGSKIALGIFGGGVTAVITKIVCDRRREDKQRPETFEQENVEL